MEEWIANPYIHVIMKLLFAREKQTVEELRKLEEELRTENRFFPRNKIMEIIDQLIEAPHRILQKGTITYRARTISKHCEEEFFAPFLNDVYKLIKEEIPDFNEHADNYEWMRLAYCQYRRGKKFLIAQERMDQLYEKYGKKGWWGYNKRESDAPPKDATGNGRINPKGISYLYVANNEHTAALEVRPVISQYVSIAEVEVKADVKLFDFTGTYKFEEAEKYFDQSIDLSVLGEFFSQPNCSGEKAYLATQYISEYIKQIKDKNGKQIFDGLCYRSSLDPNGYNYVLFDISNPKYTINNSSVYQVMDLLGNLQLQLPLPLD